MPTAAALDVNSVYQLAFISTAALFLMMGLAYALGQLLQNPKFTLWAKTEIFQAVISIILVFLLIFMYGLVGLPQTPEAGMVIKAGLISELASDEAKYTDYNDNLEDIGDDDTIASADMKYLRNMAFFSHHAVRGARALMGSTDEISKYTRTPCVPPWLMCLMGVNGVNIRPLGGAASLMQTSNLLLYTSTASYLTNLAQIVFMSFISTGGILLIFLPLAIIMRSLPFMRPFGGGLIAICIALFFVYPILVFVESAFWNPFEWTEGETWDYADTFIEDVEGTDEEVAYGDMMFSSELNAGKWELNDGDNKIVTVVDNLLSLTSAAFLSSTFLFTLNIAIVSAAAMFFGRFLGAEVDLSRLVQIV